MIRKKDRSQPTVIDLTGPQGNAFFLLSTARKLARTLDMDENTIIEEMSNSDYDHLVETFDQYFGSFVILER
jgi:chemotaxis protein CheY-P-specific phosphatase CheC